MNFKKAREQGKLDQFAKDHEIENPDPLGKERFEALLDLMSQGKKSPDSGTSDAAKRGGYAGTRTRQGKAKGISG